MIPPVIVFIAALLLQLWDLIFRPSSARCPPGWFAEGVRPSGLTSCRPSPPANCGEPVPPNDQPCPEDKRVIERKIYCTGGMRPVQIGERVIGCQRGGYRE